MTTRRRRLDLRFRPFPNRPQPAERPLWLAEALGREADAPAVGLEGAHRADICIVGGGYTGLWTAIRLRERDPGARVTLIEGDLCGAGASGRNGGAVGHWWGKLPTLLRMLGGEDAVRVLRASEAAVGDVHDAIASWKIDCAARRAPSVWSATAPSQVGAWQGVLDAAGALGIEPPFRELTRDEIGRLFGEGPQLAGVMEENALRVQPALLARGLRRVAVERGVQVYEGSPVTRVAGEADGVAVHTARGTVVSDKVLLAMNAWMAHLNEFRPHIVVVSSDIVATEPIPDVLAARGLRDRPGGHNARQMLNYGGISPEGRVFLGRGGGTLAFGAHIGPAFDRSPRQAAALEADFRHLYPELRDVPIATYWAGAVDRSKAGLPWFGRLAPDERVHYAIGYSGHGVAAAALGGRILASMLLGRSDDWTALAPCFERARRGRFPPEPVRYVGGRMVRGAIERKELAERAGRATSWLDRRLARLAPGTQSDTGRARDR